VSAASVEIRPIAELEREAILRAVAAVGDKQEAARLLGIGKTSLYRKFKTFGAEVQTHPANVALVQAAALAKIKPAKSHDVKPPARFLHLSRTQAEMECAHLRCPNCRARLVADFE
jgi:DNA-binding transcriptional regulator YdaS (Cro superfamily)